MPYLSTSMRPSRLVMARFDTPTGGVYHGSDKFAPTGQYLVNTDLLPDLTPEERAELYEGGGTRAVYGQ